MPPHPTYPYTTKHECRGATNVKMGIHKRTYNVLLLQACCGDLCASTWHPNRSWVLNVVHLPCNTCVQHMDTMHICDTCAQYPHATRTTIARNKIVSPSTTVSPGATATSGTTVLQDLAVELFLVCCLHMLITSRPRVSWIRPCSQQRPAIHTPDPQEARGPYAAGQSYYLYSSIALPATVRVLCP